MINSFRCKETQKIFDGYFSRRLPQDIQRIVARKLKILHAALTLDDLRIPPSNHLEALRGDREGQHSIRINDQFRICFNWNDGSVIGVEITDYH